MVHVVSPLKLSILLVIKFALVGVLECANNTDVISHCVRIQPCIETYANIYNALAAESNSFNIESALYPSKRSSSVRVFVNVYGENKTDSRKANAVKYTWSINCLYAALPANVLEILSLGSILVTPRTQELNITLLPFCCKVSVDKRQNMIETVLAALQDLAIGPGFPDPRVNTAECVTKGHEPNIAATGRSAYIQAILWCPGVSVMLVGPVLASIMIRAFKSDFRTDNTCHCPLYSCCSCQDENPLVHSVNFITHFMLFIDIGIIFYIGYILLFIYHALFPPIIIMIIAIIEGFLVFVYIHYIHHRLCCNESKDLKSFKKSVSFFKGSVYTAWINLVLYHVFWLVIGVMINPIWGLMVLLITCLGIVAFSYVVYEMFSLDGNYCIQRSVHVIPGFFGLCFAVAVPVLAGQSFYGRETADDVMKTILLYIISAIMSWIFWKSRGSSSTSASEGNPPAQNPPSPPAQQRTPSNPATSSSASEGNPPAQNLPPAPTPTFTSAAATNNDIELLSVGNKTAERSGLLSGSD